MKLELVVDMSCVVLPCGAKRHLTVSHGAGYATYVNTSIATGMGTRGHLLHQPRSGYVVGIAII